MTDDDYFYITKDGEAVPCQDMSQWQRQFESSDRILRRDTIGDGVVSTVFLGLNHNFDPGGKPILWETMVFGGKYDQRMWRYTSEKDALEYHDLVIAMVSRQDQP